MREREREEVSGLGFRGLGLWYEDVGFVFGIKVVMCGGCVVKVLFCECWEFWEFYLLVLGSGEVICGMDLWYEVFFL